MSKVKDKKRRWLQQLLWLLAVGLIGSQLLFLGVAVPKGYSFIHDWMFYGINYVIIMLLMYLLWRGHPIIGITVLIFGLAAAAANSTFFYYLGDVNVLISESADGQYEVILKEKRELKNETVRLKRRGFIFGRKIDVLAGSSDYKAIEEGKLDVNWFNGDQAVITYQANAEGVLRQNVVNFRNSAYISYYNVEPSLQGKWLKQGDSDDYFLADLGEMAFAVDGKLFYYRSEDSEQQGIFGLTVHGDDMRPSFTILLNPDSEFGENGMIEEGGTITVVPIELGELTGSVYERE